PGANDTDKGPKKFGPTVSSHEINREPKGRRDGEPRLWTNSKKVHHEHAGEDTDKSTGNVGPGLEQPFVQAGFEAHQADGYKAHQNESDYVWKPKQEECAAAQLSHGRI